MKKFWYVPWRFYRPIIYGLGVFIGTFPLKCVVFNSWIHLSFSDEISAATLGAFLAFLFTGWQQIYTKREQQFMQIQAALVAVENTRISLLEFKASYIKPASEEWDKFLKDNDINIEKMSYLTEIQRTKFVKLKYNFKFDEDQKFYIVNLAEELTFVAEQKPKNLTYFHKAYETLVKLKQLIIDKNKLLNEYKSQSTFINDTNIDQIFIINFMRLYDSILRCLKNPLIDDALALHRLSFDYLINYAKENYCKRESIIFQKPYTTKVECLMPPKDYLKELIISIEPELCNRYNA
jgi:hypothetical protein